MKSALPRIEKWGILDNHALCGEVYNHPDFRDGDMICTSPLQMIHFGEMEAITKDGTYRLGKKGT